MEPENACKMGEKIGLGMLFCFGMTRSLPDFSCCLTLKTGGKKMRLFGEISLNLKR